MAEYLLGVDLGSSNIKAAVFTSQGELLSRHSVPNRIHSRKPGWMEYDPEEVWAGVVKCISACIADVGSSEQIVALSIASMGEVGVPIARDGSVLYPAISWMDERTVQQVEWWSRNFDLAHLYEISGMPLDPMYSINKIIWFRDNRPDVFKAMNRWLCLPDYIIFRLTGYPATDYTVASRTMAFDVRQKAWSREICEAVNLSIEAFPDAYQSGTVVGKVTWGAAVETGLCQGTPIVLGGHDHSCVAWISGLEDDRQIIDSTGTGEAIVAVTRVTKIPPRAFATKRYAFYPHCRPDRMLVLQHMGVVGGLLDWITSLIGCSLEGFKPRVGLPMYISHPYTKCEQDRIRALGTWVGIGPNYDASELLASVVEGLCFWFRESLELHELCFECKIEGILLTGGLARFDEITSLKSSVLDREIDVSDFPDLTLMGAAGIAGVGVGLYSSWDAPKRSLKVPTRRCTPSSDWAVMYHDRFKEYKSVSRLVAGLKEE